VVRWLHSLAAMKTKQLWWCATLAAIAIAVAVVRPWQGRARASNGKPARVTQPARSVTPTAARIVGGLELPDAPGTLALEGLVLGPDDQAVAGATVRLDSAPPRAAITNENGAFVLTAFQALDDVAAAIGSPAAQSKPAGPGTDGGAALVAVLARTSRAPVADAIALATVHAERAARALEHSELAGSTRLRSLAERALAPARTYQRLACA
jgi:hypothetical protein